MGKGLAASILGARTQWRKAWGASAFSTQYANVHLIPLFSWWYPGHLLVQGDCSSLLERKRGRYPYRDVNASQISLTQSCLFCLLYPPGPQFLLWPVLLLNLLTSLLWKSECFPTASLELVVSLGSSYLLLICPFPCYQNVACFFLTLLPILVRLSFFSF